MQQKFDFNQENSKYMNKPFQMYL